MKILSKLFEAGKKEPENFINDRRSEKRYDAPLKLSYLDPRTNLGGEALAKNICRNGLRFPVSAKIPKGTVLDVEIEDPNANTLMHSKAKVMWEDRFITGDDADDVIYEVGVKLLKKLLY